MLVVGLGAAGVAVTKILLAGRRARHHRLRLARASSAPTRADYLDGSMNAIKRWYAETTNPESLHGRARPTSIDGMDLFIGLSGARVMPPRRSRGCARRDGLRDGQPDARGHARGGGAVRADHRHRPLGLPEPDQQRARLPGHLPRRARRPRAADHRGDEDGRGARDRRDRRATTSCARTTSSRRSSTATSRRPSPRRSPHEARASGTRRAEQNDDRLRARHRRAPRHARAEARVGPGAAADCVGSTHEGHAHRRHRPASARRLVARAARPRRRGHRPLALARAGRRALGVDGRSPGTRWPAPRPPRRSPGATPSSTSPASTSPSAGTTTPSRRSATAARSGTRNLVAGLRARRPAARACSSRPRRSATTARTATSASPRPRPPGDDFLAGVCVAWEREADGAADARPARRHDPHRRRARRASGGALKTMLPPFKAGIGGPVAGGEPVPAVDPRRRRRRRSTCAALDGDGWSGRLNGTRARAGDEQGVLARRSAARCTGPAFAPVPAFALRLLYGDMAEIVTEGQRAVPARALAQRLRASATPTSTRRCGRPRVGVPRGAEARRR